MNSICIATYNGEQYIKEQLDSILKQIASDDEVIISDDSSTDHTIEIIKSIISNGILKMPLSMQKEISSFYQTKMTCGLTGNTKHVSRH